MGVLRRLILERGQPAEPAARWRIVLSGLLTLFGLGISVYLTIVHFVGNQILACPAGPHSVIDCSEVITSPQSYVFGIPVAVLGLAFYTVMAGLNSPWAWRASDRRVHLARLVLSVAGMGFVLYLISAELLIIKAICIWCTSVHIVTFAQLLLVMATVPAMIGWGARPEVATPTGKGAKGRASEPRRHDGQAGRPASGPGRPRSASARTR